MTEGRKDVKTEGGNAQPPAPGADVKLSSEVIIESAMKAFTGLVPAWGPLALLDLLKGAVVSLRQYITTKKVAGITWANPYAQLDYEVEFCKPPPDLSAANKETLVKAAGALVKNVIKALPDLIHPHFMSAITQGVAIDEDARGIILADELDKEVAGLSEPEKEKRLAALGAGFELAPIHMTGTADTPSGKQSISAALIFAIRPLTIQKKRRRVFFPIQVGLNFTEGDPSAWSEEDREVFWSSIIDQIDALAAPYLKDQEAKGEEHPAVQKPDRAIPIRAEYFKISGRLLGDTARHAEAQGDLPSIQRWYMQTAFNRTVGMAAAALTKTDTREAILDWQSATVADIADLILCRSEDGTPAHGQNRQDILKAFEALRAIPVPIVKIDWKQIGTDRNPRYIKEYKLRVASLLQSYGAVFVDKTTGKEVRAADPAHKKDVVKARADRRKTIKELVAQNPADGILESFPPERFTLTSFEWRWNTDIAEDFICPQVALDKKNRPRLKLRGGYHIEGSRFVMLNKRYFAVQKHLRDAGMIYAPRLLDLVVSEKTHITSRGKAAVWIEIQAEKVIKWLGLWTDYQDHPRHVLEDHIAGAIMALIREKVMLPESWLVPQKDKNPARRKADFYRWKVAELWSTVALVPPEEAKDIEAELVKEAEAAEVAQTQPKADQAVLPGMEAPPAPPIPDGAAIRAAREAAGLNLRRFAEVINGPDFSTWSRYENGKPIRVGSIKPEAWQKVRDFIVQHRPKARSEG